MPENPETGPQSTTAANQSYPQARLILQNNGSICIGLQRHGDPNEVILTIEEIAVIAETLDRYQQHGCTPLSC